MALLNLVVDENILLIDELFGTFANITRVNARTLSSFQVQRADALVLRSTAKVNEALLAGSSVQFVGTCTIGTDHLDTRYMDANQIAWSNAPGCNAQGVGDYVIACINHAWQTLNIDPTAVTIGVVGAGNVGGRLAKRLQAAHFKVIQCDPPKSAQGYDGYLELDQLLAESDIVCLHTPLTKTGAHPTQNLLHKKRIDALAKGTVIISAGRGEVVDQKALLERQQTEHDLHLYMDVWHTEPNIDRSLYDYCHSVTPHIAGHSLEGKMRGTYMIYQALCEHFSLQVKHKLKDLMPKPELENLLLDSHLTAQQCLKLACDSVYPLMDDDQRMRQSNEFDGLRKNYPVRREFSSLKLEGITAPAIIQLLSGLGFDIKQKDR